MTTQADMLILVILLVWYAPLLYLIVFKMMRAKPPRTGEGQEL
jgi:hypothetical protein